MSFRHPNKTLCLALMLVSPALSAGYFNCAVVYDEFESLMNGQFLVEPDRFAATQRETLSRAQFERRQKGNFRLYSERTEMGIGIFRTNENLHGKMLFHWEDAAGQTHLILDEVVVFARVADGAGAARHGPLRVKPGTKVDLDTFSYVLAEDEDPAQPVVEPLREADLIYGIDPRSGEPAVSAINDASIQFPLETLCHRPKRRR